MSDKPEKTVGQVKTLAVKKFCNIDVKLFWHKFIHSGL